MDNKYIKALKLWYEADRGLYNNLSDEDAAKILDDAEYWGANIFCAAYDLLMGGNTDAGGIQVDLGMVDRPRFLLNVHYKERETNYLEHDDYKILETVLNSLVGSEIVENIEIIDQYTGEILRSTDTGYIASSIPN